MFSYREKANCAKREVEQRRFVYERAVKTGRMKEGFAQRQIALMEEIADDYEKLADEEDAKERLL